MEIMIGSGEKINISEVENIKYARKSIVAKKKFLRVKNSTLKILPLKELELSNLQ